MALNRYFQRGQSGYQSQYVPLKLPFQLMQQNLAQKDAQVDAAKQQAYGLTQTDALGLQDLGISPSEANYYGGTEAAITQKFGKRAVDDYKRSINVKNELDTMVSEMLSDDFIMKAASGDIADSFLIANKKYAELQNINKINEARIKWRSEAEKERAKHGADIMSSPWLDTPYELELQKMESDPNYVPSNMPTWGKSMDRSSLLLKEVDRLKDNSRAGEKIQPGELYTKWSKWSGRTGDEYEQFALSILDNKNSAIRRDIDAQVNAHIQAGLHKEAGLTEEEFREQATMSEINNLIESARQLEHSSVDTKYSTKSEFTYTKETAPPPYTIPGADMKDYGSFVSYNDLETRNTYLNQEIPKIEKLIASLPDGDDKKVQYQKTLDAYNIEKNTIDAQIKLANLDIENSFGTQLEIVRQGQINQLLFENPEEFASFVKQDRNGNSFFDERSYNRYAQSKGISNPEEFKSIIKNKVDSGEYDIRYKDALENKDNLMVFNNLETILGATTATNFKNSTDSANEIYTLSQMNKETLDNALYQMGYNEQDLSSLSKDQTIDIFRKEMSKVKKYNNEKIISTRNANELYSQIDQTKTDKVRQNPYDYYDAMATMREINSDEVGYVAASLDVSNSYIVTADGTKIEDPIVLERIAQSLSDENKNIKGITSRDGNLIVKEGISAFDLASPNDLAILESQLDAKEYEAKIAELKSTPANINKVVLASGYGSQLKQNTINEIERSTESSPKKSSMISNVTNEGSITRMNDKTNKLISSISGEGQYTENLDETIIIPIYDETGGKSNLTIPVVDVKINNTIGSTPSYEYNIVLDGQLTPIIVSSPDSRYLQEKIIYNIYGTNQ